VCDTSTVCDTPSWSVAPRTVALMCSSHQKGLAMVVTSFAVSQHERNCSGHCGTGCCRRLRSELENWLLHRKNADARPGARPRRHAPPPAAGQHLLAVATQLHSARSGNERRARRDCARSDE
jgi:hypothetical protein